MTSSQSVSALKQTWRSEAVPTALSSKNSMLHQLRVGTFSGPDARIILVLAILSLATLVLYAGHAKIQRLLPPWLKPFAQEDAPYHAKSTRWTAWTLCLAIVCFLGLTLSIVSSILDPTHPYVMLETMPWLVATLITAIDRPTKTPKLLLLQYLLLLFASLAIYTAHFLSPEISILDPIRAARTSLVVLAIIAIGNMPIRDPSWGTSEIGSARLPPTHHVRSPEDNLTLFQFWTMTWVYPLAKVARAREITVEDVWQLPFDFQHTRLYMAFRELEGKLLPCLIEANGLDLFLSTALSVVEKVSEVSNIRLTSKLYNALDANDPSEAALWCLIMLAIDFIRQLSKTSSGWYSRKAYERCRGETFIRLFGKLLTRAVPGSEATEKDPAEAVRPEAEGLQSSNRFSRFFSRVCGRRKPAVSKTGGPSQSASNAKVVNLVRGDTYEISQRFWEAPRVVSQPIKVVFTVYYLIDIMGWPSCIGFGLMGLFLAFNSVLVRESIKLERVRASYSDRRAQAVSHFVEASRPLKLNGWTSSWSGRIMKFRDLEMTKRLQISLVGAAISTVNVLGGAMYPLASITLYTLILGKGLPNDVIWPSLQLFGHLESSVKEAFDLISAYWKATIPVERVNKYMSEPDRDEESNAAASKDIELCGASFSRPSTDQLVLCNVTAKFTTGLTVIRGKVGSGKSSLLLAMLNEMEHRGGHFSRPDEPVAYAQQLPWIQDKTIRENILFHQGYDPVRYREVLSACALVPDLATLSKGDQTKLEEGGIGLSGGQKARVALARAVYSQCRILLLDDPLAALDHDTASTIVKRFLCGPLAEGRTIVMVTHRDDLVLRHSDQVIDIVDGRAHVLSDDELQEELKHPLHTESGNGHAQTHETIQDDQTDDIPGAKEAPEEPSETGSIPLSIYLKYMTAGGWHLWVLLAVFYGLSRYCDIARARLLEAWGNESVNTPELMISSYWSLPNPSDHPKSWLYVLASISGAQIATFAIAQVLLARISISAARGLFKVAIEKVSKASFRYHDVTPTGQLKNRLISDMGMVDGGILSPLESFVYNLIALTLSLVAIMSHQPSLIIILIGVALLFVYFFRIYVPVSRCLRRMEMRYLTPIIANIGVMQDGLVTIRALRVESHFQDRHLDAVDDFQKQDHFFWSMAFWLDFRLGTSSACMRAVLILSMVWYGTAASAIGFVLTQTTVAMSAVQQLCERFAALQLDAVSLERVDALNRIPEEPTGDIEPPADWPRPCDSVRFEAMSFKYADDLPSVLDKISFEIPGGSTCAVLGRTGSGKSTIANALLATQTPSTGKVKIGSIDLSRVNRTALRNRVTFIQQDPTLFPGTLRDNIDPEGKFSDSQCNNAIRRVLGPEWGLYSQIDAGGKNLSQGQRQLVGIGRAVLRRSGLVILDEATASIDRGTAARVQRILREELSKSTVITIAHRLEAVEDANWCLRLDHGKVVECGPAEHLGSRSKSH
ncbi:ATP-binding cassette transporter abc4 [Neonectria ditissima]|uniref:ATP-binding cassette transporter abc4 n=1 Tax=Neonectria ditissima TaxID=78410 RepID=A0A0P7BTI7_9HYPO|nr:ATP-binding cassette transporter abc4 [Neonectria ditissima]